METIVGREVLVAAAAICGFGAAACLARWALRVREAAERRRRALNSASTSGPAASSSGGGRKKAARSLDAMVIEAMRDLTRRIALGKTRPMGVCGQRTRRFFEEHAAYAGIAGTVSVDGYRTIRAYLSLGMALVGLAVGALFSTMLSVIFCVGGFAVGWRGAKWAILTREKVRVAELERHLSEMLEVIALGLRSGLSFDRSMTLYIAHFDTLLAESCDSAQRQWQLGLATREKALKDLADSYSSNQLQRVTAEMIRSLRFGTSLAESLESQATMSRELYRAKREEQVAKAPVKMLIPTGTLILPAMLMLVLGPVLLDLMAGV